jgi:DNA-binding transcriptional MerR regulator
MNSDTTATKLTSKDVAARLGIEAVTVRKYSKLLESHGYSFDRDTKGWRLYNKNDLSAIEYLYKMSKIDGHSLKKAAEHIANLYRSNLAISQSDTPIQDDQKHALLQFIKQQEEFNKKILERIELFEQRQQERDEMLMRSLRESQETQKMLAAAREKKWWQFWK